VAQGVSPEFKPQYHRGEKKKTQNLQPPRFAEEVSGKVHLVIIFK
jgi:hypothetical protein